MAYTYIHIYVIYFYRNGDMYKGKFLIQIQAVCKIKLNQDTYAKFHVGQLHLCR